jgi:D-lactate dehydrogenase (cytochrome)
MSLPARAHAPSRALLSALTRTNAAATAPTLRRTAASQRRWESTEQKHPEQHGRSFKGQLYESTTARLEKERADRKRFARQRNEGTGGRNAAMTFGPHPQPHWRFYLDIWT